VLAEQRQRSACRWLDCAHGHDLLERRNQQARKRRCSTYITADELLLRSCFKHARQAEMYPASQLDHDAWAPRREKNTYRAKSLERLAWRNRRNKSRKYSSPHLAMCDSNHAVRSNYGATMCADSRQGKPTERWRRKVSGLKSHALHDSGTAEIQSAHRAASVSDDASYRWWSGGGMTGCDISDSVFAHSLRRPRLALRCPRVNDRCAPGRTARTPDTAFKFLTRDLLGPT